jgi:uncharacterized membrane protein
MESVRRIVDAIINVHPPHVMAVHFPIALTAAALLFLLLALWRRHDALEQAAFFNITLAAISTALAGLTGYRDHVVRFESATPYVHVKIYLAISLLALTTLLAISRWRRPKVLYAPNTTVLYVAGFVGSLVLASALGFTGGAIVYGW